MLIVSERFFNLPKLFVECGYQIGEHQAAASPAFQGSWVVCPDARKCFLIAVQGIEITSLKEVNVADVAEAQDLPFGIAELAIERQRIPRTNGRRHRTRRQVQFSRAEGIEGEGLIGGIAHAVE